MTIQPAQKEFLFAKPSNMPEKAIHNCFENLHKNVLIEDFIKGHEISFM